ncbi:hypothetical protein RUM43_013755 [Polyplax serrata]|uniref:Protein S-acyltransferase n=1 Tax=Polyplax serrata TaxID=468196 RepID=A0AAN8S9K5_POLSC
MTTVQYCVQFWKGELRGIGRFNIVFLFFAAIMFAVSLLSLFCYHCYLVLHNRTTLEAFRAPLFAGGADKDGFSIGAFNNFQEVFGENHKTWFLPIFTSLGDGVTYPQKAVDEDCHHLLGRNQWGDEPDVESSILREENSSDFYE